MKKQLTLSEKLKRYSLLTGGALATAIAADAQVIYTNVSPDFTGYGDNGDAFLVDLNNDGITDFNIVAWISGGCGSQVYYTTYLVVVQPQYGNAVAALSNLPQAIDSGITIGSNLIWEDDSEQKLASYYQWWARWGGTSYGGSSSGNFLNQTEKFLGVRFTFDGEQHYGWIRLSVSGAYQYTIHDYAYEALPNNPITAGDTGAVVSCQPVTGLNTANIKSTSAKLEWDAVPDALAYMIHYKIKSTQEWTTIFATDNQKKINGLLPSTTYVWQIKDLCETHPSLKSDWSAKQEFTTTPLRLNAESAEESSLQIFPNPTNGRVTLLLNLNEEENAEAKIEVLNMLGQIMQSQQAPLVEGILQEEIQFNNDVAQGMYLVKVIVGDKVFTSQINLQK